ncbi:hypothetical protein BKA67DRAFT_540463 [Truncatella angustata]|uniref:Uncharacterized protein n=1 Tax=Truncatella angustata TaxID=152316 RepID=A0A9P8UA51_9PEZI|nr:uncharacterized protein BKA67DRAFT_540463 [Truncatella angustata]KAH6646999.1 hypothetical protein BKA67DRAFT_540463 [Truncatella angustata]
MANLGFVHSDGRDIENLLSLQLQFPCGPCAPTRRMSWAAMRSGEVHPLSRNITDVYWARWIFEHVEQWYRSSLIQETACKSRALRDLASFLDVYSRTDSFKRVVRKFDRVCIAYKRLWFHEIQHDGRTETPRELTDPWFVALGHTVDAICEVEDESNAALWDEDTDSAGNDDHLLGDGSDPPGEV